MQSTPRISSYISKNVGERKKSSEKVRYVMSLDVINQARG
jgi:hypothetical protein